MKKCLLTLLVVTLTGCATVAESPKENVVNAAMLLGTWQCKYAVGDVFFDTSTTYAEDGALKSNAKISGNRNGEALVFSASALGTWSLKNNVIYDDINDLQVFGLNPASKRLEQTFKSALASLKVAQSTILKITMDQITVKRNDVMVCDRV